MRKSSSHPKILKSETRNQPEKPVLHYAAKPPADGDSVISSAWSTDASQRSTQKGIKFQISVKTHLSPRP